jgi:hypothetical protein
MPMSSAMQRTPGRVPADQRTLAALGRYRLYRRYGSTIVRGPTRHQVGGGTTDLRPGGVGVRGR